MIIDKPYFAALALGIATISASAPAYAQSNAGASQADSQFELAFWQAVATSEDKAQYEAYLAKYPNGTFSALAALKITALSRGVASAAPATVSGSLSYGASSGGSVEPGVGSGSFSPSYSGSGMGGGPSVGSSSITSGYSGSGSSGNADMGGSSISGYDNSSMGSGSSIGSSSSSAGYSGSSMGSGSSSSGYSGSSMGSSSIEGSSSSSGMQGSNAGQTTSTKKQLLGAALSIGAALLANSKEKKAARQANSLSSGGSSSGQSSSGGSSSSGSGSSGSNFVGSSAGSLSNGSSQPKSNSQGILGQLLPVASQLTGGKLGNGNVGGSGGQSGEATAMLVNTALQLVMPDRPSLSRVDTPNLPSSFCSADARNAFYEGVFKPAMEKADKNNTDSIAYMQVLQQLFDAAGQKKDNAKMNSFSSESQSFSAVADQVQSTRLSFNSLFSQLMAVPMGKC